MPFKFFRRGRRKRGITFRTWGLGADVKDQAVVFDDVAVFFGYIFLGDFDFFTDEFNDFAGFHADHVVVVMA